jgi:hypothetical protein
MRGQLSRIDTHTAMTPDLASLFNFRLWHIPAVRPDAWLRPQPEVKRTPHGHSPTEATQPPGIVKVCLAPTYGYD